MILYIDTTGKDKLEVALYDQKGQKGCSLVRVVDRDESEKLLRAVDEVVASPYGDSTTASPYGDSTTASPYGDSTTASPYGDSTVVEGIVVVRGPKGRFSAIRTGVVCANALAFAWNVPVVGIESIDDIKSAIKRINKAKTFKNPVEPTYEKDPNLGAS